MGSKEDDFKLMQLKPEEVKFTKNNSITFKLHVSPTSADSTTFELMLLILDGSEGVRPAVTFCKVIGTVFRGMNANNADKKDGIVSCVLKGNAKLAYDRGVEDHLNVRWELAKQAAKDAIIAANGDAAAQQAAYNNTARPAKNDDDIQAGVNAVGVYMCPYKALPCIKHWL